MPQVEIYCETHSLGNKRETRCQPNYPKNIIRFFFSFYYIKIVVGIIIIYRYLITHVPNYTQCDNHIYVANQKKRKKEWI